MSKNMNKMYLKKMYQILVRLVGRYAPIVTFPIAVVLGVIGYNLESVLMSKKKVPIEGERGLTQEREDRMLNDEAHASKDIELIFTQRNNIFDKNDAKHLKNKSP